MSSYEKSHNDGHAYETYKMLACKFTLKFKKIEKDYLVALYMFAEYGVQSVKDELRELSDTLVYEMMVRGLYYDYPYMMTPGFPHTHPVAKEAVLAAKLRMELL